MRFTQITFRHMPHSGPLGERIRELSTRLEERHPQIRLCRVSVEEPQKRKGERILQITVDVRVPDGDIVSVSRGTDAESVLREAFADLGRKLQEDEVVVAPPVASHG